LNNTTTVIFDSLISAFYIFAWQQDLFEAEDLDASTDQKTRQPFEKDHTPSSFLLLNAFVLFGSMTSAILISPQGLKIRELGESTSYIVAAGILVSLVGFSIFLAKDESTSSDAIMDDSGLDPSKRLLDLWDEKFENKTKK
jgi:hypothetical protein